MNIKKIVTGLLAAMALSGASAAYAADNGTEFGIEDDLTVLGSTGTWADPDVELRGFTVFGPLAGPQVITSTNGNVAIRGNLQVDATSYFGSSVTIAGQAIIGSSLNVSGYGVFQSTVVMGEGNLKYGAGAAGQVMKSAGDGFVFWGTDNSGSVGGGAYRMPIWDNTGNAFVSSPFLGNSNTPTNITMLSGSSLTINGPFESTGPVKLGNATAGLGDVTIAGVAGIGGALNVTGDADLNARLNVDSFSTFVASMTAQGDTQLGDNITDAHGINKVAEAGVALSVDGTGTGGDYVAKFYSNNSLAAWIKKK
ncbi:MAG: hypothetical protein Q7R35_06655 [Elusimicrobiota bacterium]|nr:hypothetical protein [Elusimicrobiota bacterium]